MAPQSTFICRRDLSKELGVTKHTILRWTANRGFPKPMPNSGQVPIYDKNEVEDWLRKRPSNEA